MPPHQVSSRGAAGTALPDALPLCVCAPDGRAPAGLTWGLLPAAATTQMCRRRSCGQFDIESVCGGARAAAAVGDARALLLAECGAGGSRLAATRQRDMRTLCSW